MRTPYTVSPVALRENMVLQGVLHFSGQLDESVAAGELALAMSGRLSWSMAALAATLAGMGKPEDADAVYSEMSARARRLYVPPAQLALAAAAAARENEAILHARDAFEILDPSCQETRPMFLLEAVAQSANALALVLHVFGILQRARPTHIFCKEENQPQLICRCQIFQFRNGLALWITSDWDIDEM